MWQSIFTAPFERDLQLAVINEDGTTTLEFPCRRSISGWVDAETKQLMDIDPTHWREWSDEYV